MNIEFEKGNNRFSARTSAIIYNYDKIKDELQTNIRLQEEIRIIKDKLNE